MTDTDLLLSDEFVAYAAKIKAVHEEKKTVEEEFKKHFEEYKSKKKEFETKVNAANAEWEDWKKSQLAAVKKEK
jgi:hypothetical protein